MRKILVPFFLMFVVSVAFGQVSQLKQDEESNLLKLYVFAGDELIACKESDNLENIISDVIDKYSAEEKFDWYDLLYKHKCKFVQQGSILTVIGLTADGDQLEDYEAYEWESGSTSFLNVRANIERDEDYAQEMSILAGGVALTVYANGNAWWLVSDFLDDVSYQTR